MVCADILFIYSWSRDFCQFLGLFCPGCLTVPCSLQSCCRAKTHREGRLWLQWSQGAQGGPPLHSKDPRTCTPASLLLSFKKEKSAEASQGQRLEKPTWRLRFERDTTEQSSNYTSSNALWIRRAQTHTELLLKKTHVFHKA